MHEPRGKNVRAPSSLLFFRVAALLIQGSTLFLTTFLFERTKLVLALLEGRGTERPALFPEQIALLIDRRKARKGVKAMQRFIRPILVSLVALTVTAGVVQAASLFDITGRLGGRSGDFFDLNGVLLVDSLKVGSQGVGGVTFFNGTIVNNTTDTNNNGLPVTFGDDVRIDGVLHRGATAGPGDNLPLKLNDDVQVYGNLTLTSGKTATVTGVTWTGLSSDDLSDVASLGKLNEAETITANWVNTANPWAADEIADVIRRVTLPLASFLTDANGTPAPLTAATVPNLAYGANQGVFLEYAEDDAVDIGTQFTIPADYASGGAFKVLLDTSAAIVTDWNLDFAVAIGQSTGTLAWDTDMDNETPVDIPSNPGKPNVVTLTPTDASDFSAGDTVFLNLFPDANTAAGEPNVEIYAVWFEYTATQ